MTLSLSLELTFSDPGRRRQCRTGASRHYISGDNETNTKISMTTPYSSSLQTRASRLFHDAEKMATRYATAPDDENIQLTQVPPRIMPAIDTEATGPGRFWQFEKRLRKALAATDYKSAGGHVGKVQPAWPSMLRRNEVQYVVAKGPASKAVNSHLQECKASR